MNIELSAAIWHRGELSLKSRRQLPCPKVYRNTRREHSSPCVSCR
jgi:hypothetical protein